MEGGGGGVFDERVGGVEGAGSAAVAGVHEGFEGAAEHLGVDRGLGPGGGVLAGGKAVAAEESDDEITECGVVEAGGAVAAFKRGGSEEAAVEEGDAAEGAGGRGAVAARGVEGAEKEGAEDAVVEAAASGHARVEVAGEERGVAIEPAFGLKEGEEEEAGGVEEGEFAGRWRRRRARSSGRGR